MAFGVNIQCFRYLAPLGGWEGWYFIYSITAIFAAELLKNILLYEVFSVVVIEVNMTFTIDFSQMRTAVTVSSQ